MLVLHPVCKAHPVGAAQRVRPRGGDRLETAPGCAVSPVPSADTPGQEAVEGSVGRTWKMSLAGVPVAGTSPSSGAGGGGDGVEAASKALLRPLL